MRNGPGWQKTLLIITYDEWGGFFDHVPPFKRPVSAAETQLGNDGYLGFRVPMVLIGPRVKRRHVSHWPLDPSSIHQLLTWRFGLNALGARGGLPDTNSIAYALDFVAQPNAPLKSSESRNISCLFIALRASLERADSSSGARAIM